MNISEHQILIVSGIVLKQCYLHKMGMIENNNVYIIVIYVVITVNYCNAFCYLVHITRSSMYIGYLTLNKYY